jgi:glycerophosphoryl diester phosphodiesterase
LVQAANTSNLNAMTPTRRDFTALTLGLPLAWSVAAPAFALARRPLVISAGGGVGDIPARTAGAYDQAIRDGADFLAADLYPTKDGSLVVRPDHELSSSTDITARPEFANRRRSRVVEGRERSGWFIEDFTLAELKTLVCGAPGPRRRGGAPDGAGRAILTFEDMVAVARAGSVRTARVIGLQVGMAHTAYFAGLELALEPRVADAIRVAGYNTPAAAMWVAARDGEALKSIGELTRARRVLRLSPDGKEAADPAALKRLRTVAEAIAADAGLVLDLLLAKTTPATSLVSGAHAVGLGVQAWTSGPDVVFPPPPFKPGDGRRLLDALFTAGVDAVAGDQAAPIARARDDVTPRDKG